MKRLVKTLQTLWRERKRSEDRKRNVLSVFMEITQRQYADGVIGKSRYKHSLVMFNSFERFLVIHNLLDISPGEVTPELLMEFREFLFDEYKYVEKHPSLFLSMRENNIPRKRRGNNTVVICLNRLQAIFAELEEKELIAKNPFRKLGKERRKYVMRERYDEPIYLKDEEFQKVLTTKVPKELMQVKKVFLLQCAIGCRISDFRRLTKDNLSISSQGIPFVHYLPQKTMNSQMDYKEVCTPLVRFAFEYMRDPGFTYPIIKRESDIVRYNEQIRKLLRFCDISRTCTVFVESENRNIYVPLYQLASSKICRKTHIDLMNKVQINQYVAGLHKVGSSAINRYTSIELKDQFVLMCAAFKQPVYYVDQRMHVKM